jgi:nucleoside-diphosphate-sugar epimerase
MAFDTAATTFVTGAAGFIGTELVKELTDRGHHVLGLAESADEATRLRRIGATAVMEPTGSFTFRPTSHTRCI